jgi:dihydrofolate synthase/folylpolyglutamate synthase
MSLSQLWKSIQDRTDYEKCERPRAARFSLESMTKLMDRLGNPHLVAKTIHVAGSKGKGSVCHFLEKGLRASGLRTGLYTSPHLTSWKERIQVNGSSASDAALADAFEQVLAASVGDETFFDLLTASAFLVFNSQACDVWVVETGLGGRFDSTNVLKPMTAVVTSIEGEHLDVLGPTLKEVAFEKAGVFKVGSQNWSAVPNLPTEEEYVVWGNEKACPRKLGHPQEHMQENYGLARAVLEALPLAGVAAAKALDELTPQQLQIPGRWQKEETTAGQTVILDIAHSEKSLTAVLQAFREQFKDSSRGVLLALRDDKDAVQLAKSLGPAPEGERWWVTLAGEHPRSAEPAKIAPLFGAQILSAPSFPEGPDVLLVTGSTYLVGYLLSQLS